MKSSRSLPKNWPSNVTFINYSRYHASVSAQTRLKLGDGSCLTPSIPLRPRNGGRPVLIRSIADPAHPAFGQFGLFAASKIYTNEYLIEYIGEIHCEDRVGSDYDLSLYRFQNGTNVGIDAHRMGNEARFTNDYRGIAPKPNAVFREVRTAAGELHMSIWSSREIKRGEEILVSYGKGWWTSRCCEPQS